MLNLIFFGIYTYLIWLGYKAIRKWENQPKRRKPRARPGINANQRRVPAAKPKAGRRRSR